MKQQTNPIKKSVMVALALVLITSCKEGDQSSNAELKKCKKKIETLEKENRALKEQLGSINDKRPDNIIQSDFAKDIYHLYDKREELINEVVGTDGEDNDFKATRSLFYDLDDLNNYLAYVKKQSRKAKVKPTGLRFYFALYPDDYLRGEKDKKYAKRQTIFIAPTKEVKDAAGNTEQLGYTLDNNYGVQLLREKLDFDSRATDKKGKSYQKASFLNFSNNTQEIEENSLIADEVAGTPPMGK
ncbi:hypothetical protein [Aquimarina sp. 2201CG14-23]|uniref:hypothetical protein n=1 Tax=Aquimarina mycalae TaxID=3040073 RepID=UPI002477EFC4|nr:hypothetical protein [Aquimarina sp. 2201CG14-23]MDH7445441.1 hypothetical protein [Aquimarina sp. 2201CG14-23]